MSSLLIDCDPGIDDSLALIMILNHLSICNNHTLAAITTVGGNATIQDTTKNTQSLLSFYKEHSKLNLDIENILIGVGAAKPIEGEYIYAYDFHGKNGIGIDLIKYHSETSYMPAAKIMSQISSDHNKLDILALGPLTNIASSLKNNPQFQKSINSITIMGGAINSKGNITPFSEFNIYNDPIAADYLFNSEIPVTLIPLNITGQVHISRSNTPWLKSNGPIAMLANQLINNWFMNEHHIDQKQFHFHDPVTIVSYLNPTLFEYENVSIKVDLTSSTTRGQTTLLPNKGNINLAVGVKKIDAKNRIFQLLNHQ